MALKLDDISKENIHKVPREYFDKLPEVIQSRAVERARSTRWNWVAPTLKWATPALAVVLLAVYFLLLRNPSTSISASELLTQVETEDLVSYLASSDMTTDEILENLDLAELEFEFGAESSLLIEGSNLEILEDLADDYFDISEL